MDCVRAIEESIRHVPILVVDDSSESVNLMQALLEGEGFFTVYTASNATQALDALARHPRIGLVLLDLMMPQVDGFEVCRRITSSPSTRHIPVIVVTGGAYTQEDSLAKSFAAGAVDYVQKPFARVEILARIRVALNLYLERTLREAGERKAFETEERYQRTFESAPIGIVHIDQRGRFTLANECFYAMTGFSPAEVIDCTIESFFIDQSERLRILEATYPPDKGARQTREVQILPKNGVPIWVNISASPLAADARQDEGSILIIENITERKVSADQLERMAYYDELTGLPNRTFFVNELERAIAQAQEHASKLAVVFLDLDHFKNINESLGHEVGDLLLKGAAERIKACVPRAILARLGGDEFAMLMLGIEGPDEVCKSAQAVLDRFREPMEVGGHEFYAGASIGVSFFPDDGQDARRLLKGADTAMYRAKELGRHNYQLFNSELDARAHKRLGLEQDLRRALLNNEFELYYQPQVDLLTHRITGVEALLRWNHPKRGRLPPDEYLGMAEETGLIVSIGDWVLNEACRQARTWLQRGLPPIVVYVNLSLRQFQQLEIIDKVERALHMSGLPASSLGIEITESINSLDKDQVVACLEGFHDLGVVTAIDDFGMGYSSLNNLKHLPLHSLKIDKSFVQEAPRDPDNFAIVNAIVTLGKNFGLEVVAEGVETLEQLNFISGQHCDVAQGYLFSQPLPVREVSNLLADPQSLALTLEH